MDESEPKSEQVLNYMDYSEMTGPESKDSQVDENSFFYVETPPATPSLPYVNKQSDFTKATLRNYDSYTEPNKQSEKIYRTMSKSTTLLQSTKNDVLKIIEEKENQLKDQKGEHSDDAMAKMSGSIEKKRKELLTETIYKLRSHVDELEQLSRMF